MTPAFIFYGFEKFGRYPSNPRAKVPFEVAVFLFALTVSLPLSIAIFPKNGTIKVKDLHPDEKQALMNKGYQADFVYYNKGM
mmetsp:Transcript_26604/g.19942  ORF Transcript_26604/g.19942 Transcript_26604/m.19942 type:complete len:82 (-) Transcript_26604:57-302(-)